jgi:hypothetical protein
MENGTFDFLQDFDSDRPGKQPGTKLLQVANALPVHELRQALAKKEFQPNPDSRWPTAPLRKSRGSAQLRPAEIDNESLLPPHRVLALEKSMFRECQKLSDHDADVLDALSAIYLQRARTPTDDVAASINELLEMRGLRPRLSGQKRRGGFSSLQRSSIKQSLAHLEHVWLTFPDFRLHSRKIPDTVQTRCFVLSERKGQLSFDGSVDFREFSFRPGPTYGAFLFGPWRQVALLTAKALQYDPIQQMWEKRIARYLSWQWRIRANSRAYFKPLSVFTLLEVVGATLLRPARTRERLERCLDILRHDRVITQWQYHGYPDLLTGETNQWKDTWTHANILIEPPDLVKDAYLSIGKRSAPPSTKASVALGDSIRRKRQTRGLTILSASQELNIPPLQLDLLECGRKSPSIEEFRILHKWLAA